MLQTLFLTAALLLVLRLAPPSRWQLATGPSPPVQVAALALMPSFRGEARWNIDVYRLREP